MNFDAAASAACVNDGTRYVAFTIGKCGRVCASRDKGNDWDG